ncbi:MAG: S8 family serine peptidase [Immundisolibacterales bacterium]|nr:S8 family serine peptidase [Immundisolibacterales bacterium]
MNRQHATLVAIRAAFHGPAGTLAGMLAAALLLSACAGGSKYASPDCIATHEEGCLSAEEFEEKSTALAENLRNESALSSQWPFATMINAYEAYGRLALVEGGDVEPGAGQTIGVLDTGIDPEHLLLRGAKITEEFLEDAEDEIGDEYSHGTAVAGVIAARRVPGLDLLPHGVAWGADLAVFAIPLGTAPEYFNPVTVEALATVDSADADLYRHIFEWEDDRGRLDFLNLSLGYSSLVDIYPEAELRSSYGETIGVLAQGDVDEKTILVWAAGNAHGRKCTQDEAWCVERTDGEGTVDASSPGITAGLPVYFEEMRGHSLAVVAIGLDGSIANFSNRCGSAAKWCLAAPGARVLTAYFGPANDGTPGERWLGRFSGTSFAAPMVTGGLAVLKHYFRDQLPNTDLAVRLLETADRTGIYADAVVYGQGLMDLGTATSPVGTTEIALSGTVEGGGTPLSSTGLTSGGALGDGFSHSFAGHEVAAFDSLGAPFWFDLGDFASERTVPSTASPLRNFMAPTPGLDGLGARPVLSLRHEHGTWVPANEYRGGLQLGLLDTPAGATGGHLGLAEHALTLSLGGPGGLLATAFSTEGTDGVPPATGGLLSWRARGTPFALRAGWLGEREALLGTTAQGAFGGLSADAVFAGIDAEAGIGGWRLFGGAELGTVTAEQSVGLIADLTPLTTSAFALRATRPLGTDRGFSLSVAQPLRVESGEATLSVPAGRTKGGEVLRHPVSADLAPTGRQIDVAARWHRRWKDAGELRLGAVWTHEPGHRAAADPSLALLAGWRQAF